MKIKALAAGVVAVLAVLFIGSSNLRAQTLSQSQAQAIINQIQSLQTADDLSVMIQAVETTTPEPASSVPLNGLGGTYYSAQNPTWPPLPGNLDQVPVWDLGDGLYILDDTNIDYDAPVAQSSSGRGMMADISGPPSPGGGDSGTNYSSNGSPMPPVDYGTNLYIAQWSIETNQLFGTASNTMADVEYEIQTNADLTTTNWGTVGYILGSELTNWTPLTAISAGLTNNLFFRLRSDLSSDGSGIPDWWESEYGVAGIDPNSQDSAGDGWTIYQKYQMGLNPNVFFTPPAPQDVTVNYDANTSMATISWQSSPGPVVNYTVQRTYQSFIAPHQTNVFTVTTPYLSDNVSAFAPDPWQGDDIPLTYSVQANYTNGSSPWSVVVPLEAPSLAGTIIPGAQGTPLLIISAMPPNTAYIQLTEINIEAIDSEDYADAVVTNFDVPVGDFTNHVSPLANVQTSGGNSAYWEGQAVGTDGSLSAHADFSTIYNDSSYSDTTNWMVTPFYDGRAELKQNLIFQIRAASENGPLNFSIPDYGDGGSGFFGANSGPYNYPTNYAFAGFYNYANESSLLPVEGFNWFGLPYIGATVVYQLYDDNGNPTGLEADYLPAGGSLDYSATANFNKYSGVASDYGNPDIYFRTGTPQFRTDEYDFWNANPVYETGSQTFSYPVLPGHPAFSPTNQSQLLITAVGNPNFQVAGYAKLEVINSVYSGVYGYLEQYFTNAYEIDANGNVTTNEAGIVSPYGNFFATEPGPAALVTMPDLDTGQQGTCTVYAVSLQLDKNHDGVMDTSFNGPDATSQDSPFVFWCNNNYDRWALDEADGTNYMDDVQIANCPYTTNMPTPDCNYRDQYGIRIIPCTRDLQDYARLWVCGVTSNLLAALPDGSTVTLSWGDTTDPNPNNPTIDIFQATDADGGTEYLTNETAASIQIDQVHSIYVGRIGPGQSIQLNSAYFTGWAGDHFIWCGVSNGMGGLVLTISDGNGNTLAQSTAYIQIEDIKQMYERWTVGDQLSVAPLTNATLAADDGLPIGVQAFQYPASQDTNTPYILYVHGWNMESWEKDRFAESAFKRLYWQGYNGRFGLFRWPTGNDFTGDLSQLLSDPSEKDNYDGSEYNASLSGTGLLNTLVKLNAEYTGHVYVLAHSMGNVVTGEALRLASTNEVVNTYVASQAALSAHLYDESVPDYSFDRSVPFGVTTVNYNFGPNTPDIYVNWLAGNFGGGAGHIVNFYNPNDYALNANHWQLDQLFKPDILVVIQDSLWNYGYNGSASDPAPWNNFFRTNDYTSTMVNFDIVNTLTNRYEVMAYAAQSYSTALGATPNVGNVSGNIYLGRVTGSQIWPPDPTGNGYVEHFWHSAEFRGDYPQQEGYWIELLSSEAFNLR